MYRIEKSAIVGGTVFLFAVLLFAVFYPVFSRARENQVRRERGAVFIRTAFASVERKEGGAILRTQQPRNYRVELDGDQHYEMQRIPQLHQLVQKQLNIPVRVGSDFILRLFGKYYRYRVAQINAQGVSIICFSGTDSPNQPLVTLPWQANRPN